MTGQPFPTLAAERMKRLPDYLFARINSERSRMRRENIDIIDLGMGNPNDPTPSPIVQKLKEAAEVKRNQRYSVSIGIENLRREATRFYQRHFNVALDPAREMVASIGSKEAFSHLCLAILGPGDIAMVGAPTFPIHIYGPVIAGAQVVSIPMSHDTSGFGDGSGFLARVNDMCMHLCPKPKVLILNFPHNPTTLTVGQDFFKEVVRLAHRHKFYVI
ncbi:MAG: aminotransferase class I/II-fold pyridoxal phosphate-dependent enzyme, partial [Spirochaetaceae bacterium]